MRKATDASFEDSNRPRILVVENEAASRLLTVDLLRQWNYQPYVVEADGEELLNKAVEMAKIHRCHLALVDLRLLDNDDREDISGLELVPDLKPTESIILSGFLDYQVVQKGIQEWGALSFVGKQEGPSRLKERLERAINQHCASQRSLRIGPSHLLQRALHDVFPGDDQVPKDEVEDVLVRLFPDANRLRLEQVESTGLSLSRVPRPRSKIFLVYKDDLQPEVLKLARAGKIIKEVQQYKNFIEDRLVGYFSPPIKNWQALWDLGGAVYPFMGSTQVQPFARYYASASVTDIEHSLRHFFTQTWSKLYEMQTKRKKYIFEGYCDVWDVDWYSERLVHLTGLFPGRKGPLRMQLTQAPDPVLWLIDRVNGAGEMPLTKMAVTHGDLHGDNILVDENRHMWVIDFERSGFGPILQDFVELEIDILTRLSNIPEHDFTTFYVLTVWIARLGHIDELPLLPRSTNLELIKAMQVIASLRRLARECTGETDLRPYLWGLILNALFRASLQQHPRYLPNRQRALMLASILCHRLDHWETNWPPAEWPAID
jgi:CheY-like chemotaxis protein